MPQPRDDQGVGQCPLMSPVTPLHAGMAPCLSLMARTCLPVCCPSPEGPGRWGRKSCSCLCPWWLVSSHTCTLLVCELCQEQG